MRDSGEAAARVYEERLRDTDQKRTKALHLKADRKINTAQAALARLKAAAADYEERLKDSK